MAFVVKEITAPAREPVRVDQARVHLRIEKGDTLEDTYIQDLIKSARIHAEQITNRKFITQTWEYYLDDWPEEDWIDIPFGQLQTINSIKYTDSDGTQSTLSASDYSSDTEREPGRAVLGYGKSWPSVTLHPENPIVVNFKCGYGLTVNSVPHKIRQAIQLMVGHWYEHREPYIITRAISVVVQVPLSYQELLAPYRLFAF